MANNFGILLFLLIISSFSCGAEYHNPVSCEQLRIWNTKQKDDTESDSLKLITAIAKPCPNGKCGIATDRVDGCNHMVSLLSCHDLS